MDRIPYSTIRDTLQTGDKVLMSGDGDFSRLIKQVTGCSWSHVAMIVRQGDRVGLWESCNKVELTDFDASFVKPTVSTMSRRVGGQAGDIAIRRLILPEDFDRAAMQQRIEAFIAEVDGRPYETSKIELARAAVRRWFGALGNSAEALASFFCSELVAETDQRAWLLPADRPSNDYQPRDFSDMGVLPYLHGARLGPEILLTDRCT